MDSTTTAESRMSEVNQPNIYLRVSRSWYWAVLSGGVYPRNIYPGTSMLRPFKRKGIVGSGEIFVIILFFSFCLVSLVMFCWSRCEYIKGRERTRWSVFWRRAFSQCGWSRRATRVEWPAIRRPRTSFRNTTAANTTQYSALNIM